MGAAAEAQDILREFGATAKEIDGDLQKFRRAARLLSSKHPRLTDKYQKQWVGVYEGRVRVHGKTLKSVMDKITDRGLPKERVIVRFIDKNQRTMIL